MIFLSTIFLTFEVLSIRSENWEQNNGELPKTKRRFLSKKIEKFLKAFFSSYLSFIKKNLLVSSSFKSHEDVACMMLKQLNFCPEVLNRGVQEKRGFQIIIISSSFEPQFCMKLTNNFPQKKDIMFQVPTHSTPGSTNGNEDGTGSLIC